MTSKRLFGESTLGDRNLVTRALHDKKRVSVPVAGCVDGEIGVIFSPQLGLGQVSSNLN
jgi:hypothetical protein